MTRIALSSALRRVLMAATLVLASASADAATITRPAVLPRVAELAPQDFATADPVEVSTAFVDQVIHDLPVQAYLDYFRRLDPEQLQQGLESQERQLAFWINVYNGYTQHFLKRDPSAYLKKRSAYFGKDQIEIASDRVSLEDIEHGVLRRGATIYTLGHVRTLLLRRPFVRRFAVNAVDYRIHFALNCGARSCPPVMPYTAPALNQQLDAASRDYLQREVRYDAGKNTVAVPALLRWFSADFDGGSQHAKRDILRRYGLIPANAEPDIEYLDYDWTLWIENYALFTPSAAP